MVSFINSITTGIIYIGTALMLVSVVAWVVIISSIIIKDHVDEKKKED